MKDNCFEYTKSRRHRTVSEIQRVLEECQRSGLSLLAFSRQRQPCYATLLRWKARPPSEATPPAFIPVEIEPSSGSADYVLSLAGGRSLRIPAGFEARTLRALLEILEESK